ncbi:MAG TPA: DUF1329 domain-containing protein [Myxococcota bacterium]|nr:DUF1329 domain-containing protein [Myxococcota bacterium]
MPRNPPAQVCLLAFVALWSAPPASGEGVCPSVPTVDASIEGHFRLDAESTVQLKEGMVLTEKELPALRNLLPPEVWQQRETFFFEGMRMVLGPCFRHYPASPPYEEATQAFAGEPKLDGAGNLKNYKAGLPFPPETIDPKAPDAAMRWAWNLEMRHRGSGPAGKFRLTDFPSRLGAVQVYQGSFYLLQTAHRADLADSAYALPVAKEVNWVGGGKFEEPFNARGLAWRQIRPLTSEASYQEVDTIFVYVPTMRKPRRAATAWVNGYFTPRYTTGGDSGGGAVPFGASQYGPTSSISPTAGISAASSEYMRRGFIGLALRPNAFEWTLVGERDVLAPINGEQIGWPKNPEHNYGTSGLSVASDRWDVRHAVVIEGRARQEQDDTRRVQIYVDAQTAQPLYWISRRGDGLLQDVGILVHRYSGDRPDYPSWPDGSRALVFDPVAAVFFTAEEGGTGWRRESYDVTSVPMAGQDLRAMTGTAELEKGH